MSETLARDPAQAGTPLQDFSDSHAEFVALLEVSLGLPEMIDAAARARSCAAAVVKMFRRSLLAHHADEERDLFPAVLKAALPGEESAAAQAMVAQLVREHRDIAQLWKELEPAMQAAANGYLPALDPALLQELVEQFNAHVRSEENEFLPFAHRVLSRQGEQMAALGAMIHRRHEDAESWAVAVVYGAN